ncbi:MAG: CHASE domain-containing protein, partial [Kordiimonadaceae bacterium]|nr:CHASE domain-containing protein [Kordiimonadaceae bacterium]
MESIYGRIHQSYLTQLLLVATAYCSMAYLGGALAIQPEHASPLFPAVGVALAAVILGGYRLVVGVFIGALGFAALWPQPWHAEVITFKSVAYTIAVASGASVQAAVGAWLVKRFSVYPAPFETAKEIGGLILFGGLIACLCSSTLVMSTFYVFGSEPIENYAMGWVTWWIGDSVGTILVAIPLLMFFRKNTNLKKRQKWGVGLSFAALYGVMVLFYNGIGEVRQQEFYNNFDREVADRTARIKQSVTAALDMLHAIEGLFGASETVSRDNFSAFSVHMFAEIRGVQAVAWVPRINQNERAFYEKQVREEGFPDFQITERDGKGELVTAGDRRQYFPVHFVGPMDTTPKVVGFDLGSNALRFAALSKALATDKVAATAPLTLVQEPDKQRGILIFNPIFKRHTAQDSQQVAGTPLLGFAAGVFRIEEMVEAAFVGLQHKSVVNVHIQDVTDKKNPTSLYGQAVPPSLWFNITETFDVGGRIWRFSYAPTKAFGALYLKNNLWILLVSGLLFS